MAPAREEERRRARSGDHSPGRVTTPAGEVHEPRPPVRHGSPFYSATEEAFKNKRTLRFFSASAIALLTLVIIAWFGPSRDEIKRRFEIYGAEGPLEIMPEISIEAGSDAVHQLPEAFRQLPPPVADIEPIDPPSEAQEPVPPAREQPAVETSLMDADLVATDTAVPQAELMLPQQTNPDFVILKMVRPLYPLTASEHEKRLPIVRVDVAIFVDAEGRVTASMITATEGGPAFAEAVLAAMNLWEFAWSSTATPTVGRWIEMSWRFKSPYGVSSETVAPPPDDSQ